MNRGDKSSKEGKEKIVNIYKKKKKQPKKKK
jgi:hypothetical protein